MASQKLSNPELDSEYLLKILICYLFDYIDKPTEAFHIQNICISSEFVNHFAYSDALDELKRDGMLKVTDTAESGEVIAVTEKGREISALLKDEVPKNFIRTIRTRADEYFSELRKKRQFDGKIVKSEKGYTVVINIKNNDASLLKMELLSPDREQAEKILGGIRDDAAGFYSDVIRLTNKYNT